MYVRSFCISGRGTVRLVTAKSTVTPLKTESIPRLELLENLLLSQLIISVKTYWKTVSTVIKCIHGQTHSWTDSWIKAIGKEFKTFVENRL